MRRTAHATVCLTQLQQLDASYHTYLNANRNHSFPFMEDLTSPSWFELLQPYNASIKKTLLCPEATEAGNMLGGAFKAWGPWRTYVKGGPDWVMRDVLWEVTVRTTGFSSRPISGPGFRNGTPSG